MDNTVPVFMRTERLLIYRVWIRHIPLDVPDVLDGPRREIITLPSSFTMRPASRERIYLRSFLPRLVAMLESCATHVHTAMFKTHYRKHDFISVYAVMAWHLLHTHALITKLLDRNELDFTEIDVAAWAVVAVFFHTYALCEHLSFRAMSIYIDCFRQLREIFHVCGFTVYASYTPLFQLPGY